MDEFERGKMALIRGYPPTWETAGQVLGRLVDIVHFGLPDDYHSFQVERLQAVTIEDVHRVSSEHVHPDKLSIVIVGDGKVIESGLQELDLPIVHLDYEGQPVS